MSRLGGGVARDPVGVPPPAADSPTRPSSPPFALRACVLALVVALVWIRKSDALLRPQFWAEDGQVFFRGQYVDGARAVLEPYAGYLHVVPRLIALAADECFSLVALPAVYAWVSLIVLVLVVARTFGRRRQLPFPALLALVALLVPHFTAEVFLNLTNLQWLLLLWLVLLLLERDPDLRDPAERRAFVVDVAVFALAGLTGPFVLLLLPFFAWSWWRRRSSSRLVLLLVAAAAAAVQAGVLSLYLPDPVRSESVLRPAVVIAILGQKAFGNLYLGPTLPYRLSPDLLCGLLIGSWVLLVAGSRGRTRSSIVQLLAVLAVVLVATFFKFRSQPELLHSHAGAVRYFYPFNVLTAWALACFASQPERWKKVAAGALLATIFVSALASGFRAEPLPDFDWAAYTERLDEPGLTIPINPEGCVIRMPGPR